MRLYVVTTPSDWRSDRGYRRLRERSAADGHQYYDRWFDTSSRWIGYISVRMRRLRLAMQARQARHGAGEGRDEKEHPAQDHDRRLSAGDSVRLGSIGFSS